ncbi:MAG: N-acetyltransferase family protein [Eggerthellaceae bacterium]|jgi:L-amino acid N-acyltransferase YncA
MDTEPVRIRLATPDDAEGVRAVYAPYVRDTAIVFAYEPPTADEQRAAIEDTAARYPFLVAERAGHVAGFACAHAFEGFPAYDWNAETTLYVARDLRGYGIGSRLHDALEACLRAQGVLAMDACIAVTATPDEHLTNASQRFHKRRGYRLCATFPQCGYKFGRWYDMIWMERAIGERTPNPRPFTPAPETHLDQVLERWEAANSTRR